MPITTSIALALSVALGSPAQAHAAELPPAPPAQTVRQTVASYFADIPIMVAISGCESHFRQYDDNGAVYRGEQNHQDVGVMQINEYYHLKRSKDLGLDIYTVEGNLAYARYLYEQEGTAPWLSSAYCWDKSKRAEPIATAAK